ncbi:hypothetical protein Tco_0308008 [Tanacetum coccineum]
MTLLSSFSKTYVSLMVQTDSAGESSWNLCHVTVYVLPILFINLYIRALLANQLAQLESGEHLVHFLVPWSLKKSRKVVVGRNGSQLRFEERGEMGKGKLFGNLFAFVSGGRALGSLEEDCINVKTDCCYETVSFSVSVDNPSQILDHSGGRLLKKLNIHFGIWLKLATTGRMFSAASTAAMSTFIGIYGPSKMHFLRYSPFVFVSRYRRKRVSPTREYFLVQASVAALLNSCHYIVLHLAF